MARDFTYIDDIVDGIVHALETPSAWEILNLGRKGRATDAHDRACGTSHWKTIEKTFIEMQPGDVRQTWADISRAKTTLSWEPRVNLDEGIPKFVEWYRGYYGV